MNYLAAQAEMEVRKSRWAEGLGGLALEEPLRVKLDESFSEQIEKIAEEELEYRMELMREGKRIT